MTNENYEKLLKAASNRAAYLEAKINTFLFRDGEYKDELGVKEPCATWIDQAEQTYEVINMLQAKLGKY
ncbi:hypothetical protein ACPA0F_18325 [Solibacillus silvestris]